MVNALHRRKIRNSFAQQMTIALAPSRPVGYQSGAFVPPRTYRDRKLPPPGEFGYILEHDFIGDRVASGCAGPADPVPDVS
jgi:hypothetical protein